MCKRREHVSVCTMKAIGRKIYTRRDIMPERNILELQGRLAMLKKFKSHAYHVVLNATTYL
jgi:hypothetical protein